MKLQSIKKEIIKVVPEIMELKFGCEVEIEVSCYGGIDKFVNIGHDTYRVIGNSVNEGEIEEYDSGAIEKIIGRPITLADCVTAIIANKKWKAKELKEQAKVFFNLCMYWDMDNEDNLDKKDELVINYLYKILKS